jgi:hypothetical protein
LSHKSYRYEWRRKKSVSREAPTVVKAVDPQKARRPVGTGDGEGDALPAPGAPTNGTGKANGAESK